MAETMNGGYLFRPENLAKERKALGLDEKAAFFDEEKHHSAASKIYSLIEKLRDRPNYQLSNDELDTLTNIRASVSRLKQEEEDGFKKLEVEIDSLPEGDQKRERAAELEKKKRLHLRIHDAVPRYVELILAENRRRIRQEAKPTETVRETFNPEEYRKSLEGKIKKFGELTKITKFFGPHGSELRDDYKYKSASEVEKDIVLLREVRLELGNERINVAGEAKKEAQIDDFVLPGIANLEKKLTARRDELMSETARSLFENWKQLLVDSQEHIELKVASDEVKKTTLSSALNEASTSFRKLQDAIGKLLAKREIWLDKISGEFLKAKAQNVFDEIIQQAEVLQEQAKDRIFLIWKQEFEENDDVKKFETVMQGSVPGGTEAVIVGQETALLDAVSKLKPTNKWIIGLPDFPELQAMVENHLKGKIDEAEAMLGRLREAKGKAIAVQAENKTIEQKKELQQIVDVIESLDFRDDDDFAKRARLEYLEKLKDNLYKVRNELRDKGIAFMDVDSRFDKQEARLLQFIERAKIAEMPFAEIVKRVKAARYDVFKSSNLLGNITDPIERSLIKRFQYFYYGSSEKYGEDVAQTAEKTTPFNNAAARVEFVKQKELEHRRLKVEIWANRYNDEHYAGQYVPAAEVTDATGEDILYKSLRTRKLFRDDILAVVNNPRFGDLSKKMLEYGIKVIAGEVVTPGEELDYGALSGSAEAPKKLKDHLVRRFVAKDEKEIGLDKLTQEQFDILWDLFVDFDLASTALARTQKDTQTRAHNTGKKVDSEFLSYPLHVLSHMRNRYGNIDTAAQHLLVFTGKYPGEYVMVDEKDENGNVITDAKTGKPKQKRKYFWSGNEDEINGTRVRTEEETRQLVIAYMEAHMPLNGIKNSVLTSGTDAEWNNPIYPDVFDFLTAPVGVPKEKGQILTAIPNTDLYSIGQEGWGRMLEMTIKSLSGGSLNLHDIFKDGGIYKQFINEGIGKAKVTTGEHYRWFVPMLRSFVGRISVAFDDEGIIARRRELKEQLIEQLKTGTGLKIKEIKKDLDAFITELEAGQNKEGPAWRGIPEILIPYDKRRRRKERIAYMKLWWNDKKKGESSPPPVSGTFMPSPRAGVYDRVALDPDVGIYYDAIEERIPLPQIIDRSAFNTDTSQKK